MSFATKHIIIFFCLFIGAIKQESFNSCNRYTSFGYGYRDYFEFHGGNFSPNQVFYMDFYVKTVSDAHILLKSDLQEEDAYEIVIGGGLNTFSQIRLLDNSTKKTMITQKTENFLSAMDYVQFWIAVDRLGIISVGKKEDDDVFLNWRFDNPLPIKYFSFGSWTNVKADWRFGCNLQKDTEIIEEEGNLTPLHRLKNDLFTLYDPNALPNGKLSILEVKVNFQVNYVQLNEKRGELTMHGSGDMKWTDAKMKWKPENYEGIEMIYVPPFQIWTPYLKVLNALAVDKSPLFDLTAAGVMVKYDGSIFWRPPFKSLSSCTVNLYNWPFDVHTCSVLFAFWMEPDNLLLTIMNEYETTVDAKTGAGWEILEVTPYNGDHNPDDNYGILYVELRRTQGPLGLILMAPYVAAGIMSLSSFWVSLEGSKKLYLSCVSVFTLLLTLFYLDYIMPAMTKTVPRIISLYSWGVIITCFPIILYVILKNIPKTLKMTESASKALNHKILDHIFCLPELPENATQYFFLSEEDNKMKDYNNAVRLVTLIERLLFFVYLIILVLPHVII